MKANTVLDTIGHTPHLRVQRLFGKGHEVWIKSERSNPGGFHGGVILVLVVCGCANCRSCRAFPYGT